MVSVGLLSGRRYLEGGVQKVSSACLKGSLTWYVFADVFDIKVAGCLEVQRIMEFFGYVCREGRYSYSDKERQPTWRYNPKGNHCEKL